MVSAIITTHNRANLLSRAINSVLNQTYQDIEIIVVSDGSTDETDKVMEGYNNNPMINYISYHPAKGGNYARNTGIKAAKGEYIAFLDDDDEWLPNKLEKQVEVMNSDSSIGMVYTGTNVIYVDEKTHYSSIPQRSGDMSKQILLINYIGSTTTVLVRKDVFDKSGLFDEKLSAIQDYDLWIRICQHTKVGVVSKELVNYYNYRNANQVSSNTLKYENAYSYIDKKYKVLYDQLTIEENNERKALINMGLGTRELRNGNAKNARKYYKASLGYKFMPKVLFTYIISFCGYRFFLKLRYYLHK